jgi:hypothetical protein
MHTVDLLEEAIELARRLGYKTRQEWLAGCGGRCEIAGQKWVFIDLSLSPAEQLDQVVEALHAEPSLAENAVSEPLARLLGVRRAA